MEEVHRQFFVSIDITRQNNHRLNQAVERTLAVAENTILVGLAIQFALERQHRVKVAVEQTRGFISDLIEANSVAIKQYTEEIGDLSKSPVVAIEKLAAAHANLRDALDTAERYQAEGIAAARENINRLRELSQELDRKSLPSPQGEPASLEA